MWRRRDIDLAVQQCHSLAHGEQPHRPAVAFDLGLIEAFAVILNLHDQLALGQPYIDANSSR